MVFVKQQKQHQRAEEVGDPLLFAGGRCLGWGGGGRSFFTNPIANINIPGNNELADYE